MAVLTATAYTRQSQVKDYALVGSLGLQELHHPALLQEKVKESPNPVLCQFCNTLSAAEASKPTQVTGSQLASPTHSPGKGARVAEDLALELFMLLNTATLETRGSKVHVSRSRKTTTNHNSMDASKLHSAVTNCPKQKYRSLYRQVPPTAEGCHKSNQEEMLVVSTQNGSGDPLREQSHCPAVTSGVTGTRVLF